MTCWSSTATEGAEPPAGSHEAGCGYCPVALRELAELWLPVRQWSERDISISRRFVAMVMSRVRRIVESSRHAVGASARGVTIVTSWALGLIVANAAEGTPGVTAISGRPEGLSRRAVVRCGADGVDIREVDKGAISVSLALTARPVASLSDLADSVRHNVIAPITEHTQLSVAVVDVKIDDLDAPGSSRVRR